MMTAIEDARAARSAVELIKDGVLPDLYELEAFVAEHERLTREIHQRELHHFRRQGPTADARDAMILAAARTFAGWNDDTSEPTLEGAIRGAAEAHWIKVNQTCIEQATVMVDAALEAARSVS